MFMVSSKLFCKQSCYGRTLASLLCRKQTRQLEETGVLEQRRQLEAHAAERARADAAGARQRAIERREEERQQDIAMQRELTLQRHMKQVWALPAHSRARTVP